jgi:hypothetical protein
VADDRIPQATSEVLEPSGKRFTVPWFRFFAALDGILATIADGASAALQIASNLSDVANAATAFGNIKQAASGTTTGVVQQTQTWEVTFVVPEVEAIPIYVILKAVKARTVTNVVTDCTSGTCTLTGAIDGVSLGGTVNSVSTTEQDRAHSSANSVAVGQDLVFTPSSVSSCLNMRVRVSGTYSLSA